MSKRSPANTPDQTDRRRLRMQQETAVLTVEQRLARLERLVDRLVHRRASTPTPTEPDDDAAVDLHLGVN